MTVRDLGLHQSMGHDTASVLFLATNNKNMYNQGSCNKVG